MILIILLNQVKNVDVDELKQLLQEQDFSSIVKEQSIYGPPDSYYLEKDKSFEPQTKL